MGLQLVTSFIHIAKVLGAQRETTQRQLNAEMKKKADAPRVESLNKRLSMTHEKITVIEEMMRKIFTGYGSFVNDSHFLDLLRGIVDFLLPFYMLNLQAIYASLSRC